MQENQRYMVLKEKMGQKVKQVVNNNDEKERAELVAKGRQEGKDEFFKSYNLCSMPHHLIIGLSGNAHDM